MYPMYILELLRSPGSVEVDFELNQFNGAVGGELAHNQEAGDQHSCRDQEPVFRTFWKQPGEGVKRSGELLYDSQQLKSLKIDG